ncbi:hypothetical protein FB45DRAFT_916644 [Roridomyces roridus]|uniref:Pentatricopeptide repeat-containing protein n=1 Tax=Roridomyces roridus TaxID=1738132 RepID=A0AAD7FNS4_9AGAR|nr:hypothetical protein FB45DRAFT_916644 [Roridomyces roridus]
MLSPSRFSSRVGHISTHLVRTAPLSFTAARLKSPPSAATDAVVDPTLFLQLRQRIIQRHNPSTEPLSPLAGKAIYDIKIGLEWQDVSRVQKGWKELRQASLMHNLNRDLIEQVGQLLLQSLATPEEFKEMAFAEDVALAAAAIHFTDTLNACLLVHLRNQRPPRLPEANDSPKEEETLPGRVNAFLAVVAARAMENAFLTALQEFLGTRIKFRPSVTDAFNKVSDFVQLVQSQPLADHIKNLSGSQLAFFSGVEGLYHRIIEAMSGPDAFIAPDRQSVTPTKPVFMSELVWASFLVAFLRRNRSDLAVKLWKDMSHFGVKAGVLTWNMVLEMYSERRATKEIVEAWGTMKTQGVQPNATTYRAKRTEDALRWFRNFEAETLSVYNIVLHGLTVHRQHSDTMVDRGPKPDLVCYNTMLGYYGRSGDFKALSSTVSQMEAAGIAGDVPGRSDATDTVQAIMRKQGIRPTVAFYTAVIDAQMREQTVPHLQAAIRLLDEMDKHPKCAPNDVTFTSILAGMYRGSWLSTSQLQTYRSNILTRMKRKKIKIRVHGYNILIKACLTSPEPSGVENALRLYREMKELYAPTNDTWFILLASLARRREWQIAEELVNEIRASGAQPSNSILRLMEDIRQNVL